MSGKDPLICFCYSIRESTIKDFISKNCPSHVYEVTEACDAGAGCTGCHQIIEEMIKEAKG